jgi:superfamily II DNA/RNA helicase
LRDQVDAIYDFLPRRKQVVALSATYPPSLAATLSGYMTDPVHVRLDADAPSLKGVTQYYVVIPSAAAAATSSLPVGDEDTNASAAAATEQPRNVDGSSHVHDGDVTAADSHTHGDAARTHAQDVAATTTHHSRFDGAAKSTPLDVKVSTHVAKARALVGVLRRLTFRQCVVFCNLKTQARKLSLALTTAGIPSAHITSDLEQRDRSRAMRQLLRFDVRALVSTDLTARGVDVERVNLVVNMDVPDDGETCV